MLKSKIAVVTIIVGAILLLSSGIAGAWGGDTSLSGTVTCNGVVTWKVKLTSSGANPNTPPVVLDSNRAIVPVGATLTQNQTFVETVTTFPVTLSIHVNYPAPGGDKKSYPASATVNAPTGCVTTTTTKGTTTTNVSTTTTLGSTTTTTNVSTTTTTQPTTTTTEPRTTTTTEQGTTTTVGEGTTTTTTDPTTTTFQTTTTVHRGGSSTSLTSPTTSVTIPPTAVELARTGSDLVIPLTYAGYSLVLFGLFVMYVKRRYR